MQDFPRDTLESLHLRWIGESTVLHGSFEPFPVDILCMFRV